MSSNTYSANENRAVFHNFTLSKCVQEYPPVLSHPSPCFYTLCLYFCPSVCHSISPSLSQERWPIGAKSYCYYFWTWTLQLNESSKFNQTHSEWFEGFSDTFWHSSKWWTSCSRAPQQRGAESRFIIYRNIIYNHKSFLQIQHRFTYNNKSVICCNSG